MNMFNGNMIFYIKVDWWEKNGLLVLYYVYIVLKKIIILKNGELLLFWCISCFCFWWSEIKKNVMFIIYV